MKESTESPLNPPAGTTVLTRDKLMSLGTIKPGVDFRITKTTLVHRPLDVSDIEGAQPRHREYHPYIQEDVDIGKRMSVTSVNKPNFLLSCRDIEGAYPSSAKGKSNRMVDPLDPDYKLPSFRPAPPFETPFTRDTLDIQDIKGTSSKPLYLGDPKPVLSLTTIPNTVVPPRPMRTWTLEVDDINMKPRKIVHDSNPCEPTYKWETNRIWKDAQHAEPPQTGIEKLTSTLQCNDIIGASVKQSEVRDVRNTNYIGDIPGAHNPKHFKAIGSPGMQKGGYILERVKYVKEENNEPIPHPTMPDAEHKAGIRFIPKRERGCVTNILKEESLPGPPIEQYSGCRKGFNRTHDPETRTQRVLGSPIYHAELTGKVKTAVGGNTIYVNTMTQQGGDQVPPMATRDGLVSSQRIGICYGGGRSNSESGGMKKYFRSQQLNRSNEFRTQTKEEFERQLVASLPRY